MKSNQRSLMWVLALIVAVGSAAVYVGTKESSGAVFRRNGSQAVAFQAQLVQDKVHKGSSGEVAVAVTFAARDAAASTRARARHVDLVLVLDRSGSMRGAKINDARQAICRLIDGMTPNDRLALVTYANGFETVSPLTAMNDNQRKKLKGAVAQIVSGGGTNLGGGLHQGIDLLLDRPVQGRQRKVILISDGLANHGITDPRALGQMAARASENSLSVSTLGVGYDFNEVLMTTIADHGGGRYYFLENPQEFARVFEKALQQTRQVAAGGMKLRIPTNDGVHLVHAGGYPISTDGDAAVVQLGDLMAGQQRKLFLTFQVPTDKERRFTMGAFTMRYTHHGRPEEVQGGEPLTVACVSDANAVTASIDKEEWEVQVVQEAYGQLKEEVAESIRSGQKDKALSQIQAYEAINRKMNDAVRSEAVADNLENDVQELRQGVEQTFAGPAAAVAEKQKQSAKALQYDGYKTRRAKQ